MSYRELAKDYNSGAFTALYEYAEKGIIRDVDRVLKEVWEVIDSVGQLPDSEQNDEVTAQLFAFKDYLLELRGEHKS